MPNRGKTTWTNRVAPEPRPLVPKFRVPGESPIVRFVGNGLFRLLPGGAGRFPGYRWNSTPMQDGGCAFSSPKCERATVLCFGSTEVD